MTGVRKRSEGVRIANPVRDGDGDGEGRGERGREGGEGKGASRELLIAGLTLLWLRRGRTNGRTNKRTN